MTDGQFSFACKCVADYRANYYNDDRNDDDSTLANYRESIDNEKMGCDIYTTKTQISAVVYHG